MVLIFAGLTSLGVGLSVWLGGMRWRIFTAVVFGVVAGLTGLAVAGLAGVAFITENMLAAFIFPAFLVMVSILIFKKRGLVVIGSISTIFVLLLSFAASASVDGTYHRETEPPSAIMDGKISTVIGDLSPMSIGVAASCGSLVMGVGLFFHRVVSAATCSALGIVLIYVGMILLLANKGSMPVQNICRKPIFYQTVAICMLFFGTFVGRLVCPSRKKKINTVKDKCGVEK